MGSHGGFFVGQAQPNTLPLMWGFESKKRLQLDALIKTDSPGKGVILWGKNHPQPAKKQAAMVQCFVFGIVQTLTVRVFVLNLAA